MTADFLAMVRILSNLVGNAMKYVPEGGLVEVVADRDGEDVRIQVKDSGPGIAPEYLERVFDRFWRVPGTRQSGSGQGLAIVKQLTEAQGGSAWVESTPGVGSTFGVTLPASLVGERNIHRGCSRS
jgi:signal transduction histidine kinase